MTNNTEELKFDYEGWKVTRSIFGNSGKATKEFKITDTTDKKKLGPKEKAYTHRYLCEIENRFLKINDNDQEKTLIVFMMNPSSTGQLDNKGNMLIDKTVQHVLWSAKESFKKVIVINNEAIIEGNSNSKNAKRHFGKFCGCHTKNLKTIGKVIDDNSNAYVLMSSGSQNSPRWLEYYEFFKDVEKSNEFTFFVIPLRKLKSSKKFKKIMKIEPRYQAMTKEKNKKKRDEEINNKYGEYKAIEENTNKPYNITFDDFSQLVDEKGKEYFETLDLVDDEFGRHPSPQGGGGYLDFKGAVEVEWINDSEDRKLQVKKDNDVQNKALRKLFNAPKE